MEEEKAENEELAQQKAKLERAQQFAQKRKNRAGSINSQSPTKKAQAKEPEEVEFNESLGKSAKSINFGNVPVDDVLEQSAGKWKMWILTIFLTKFNLKLNVLIFEEFKIYNLT